MRCCLFYPEEVDAMNKRLVRFLLTLILVLAISLGLSTGALAAVTTDETAYFNNTDSWEYTLTHTLTLNNTSSRAAYNIQVQMPLIDGYLPVYGDQQGEQLDPYPSEIATTEDGQRIAVYQIDSIPGNSSLTLRQVYALQVTATNYSIDPNTLNVGYSEAERNALQVYLQPEDLIESDGSAVMQFAQKAIGQETNPYFQARQLFSAVNLALAYSEDASVSQSAEDVLSRRTAHCEGYTNLYVACLRAVGIPARVVSGYLYMPEKHITEEYVDQENGVILLDSLRHVWVEFYLPSLGWVMADPTFTYTYEVNGTIQKFVDWDYFAKISPGRRYIFFSYGDSENDKYRITYTGGEITQSFSARMTTGKDYLPFNDLAGHWAASAITYGVEQGYFNGITVDRFEPESNMTRAMFVAVLGRVYQARGGQLVPYQADLSQFTDIKVEDYYADALGWALDWGLIEGYGDGRFGPDDPITREQMAKILTVFVALLEDTSADELLETQAALTFLDIHMISPWAIDGVVYCSSAGLITGHNDGNFRPQDNATRAQVAAIVQRIDAEIH